jgi:Fe-S-cluster containining protein
MSEIERLKEEILKEYPRLSENSIFSFNCHSGLSCFNDCCGDVNIFLTPYDIIRLKNNLGITSGEFLKKYTIMPFDENLKYPVVLLKMEENERKTCHFVSPDGCTVYNDRPWACRMYPLGMAAPGEGAEDLNENFYFLLKESVCKGFEEDRKISVADWIKEQGIEEYNEMGEGFKQITTDRRLTESQGLDPRKLEMFFTVCYDIDKFREFVFGSSFLKKFDVDEATQAKIKSDDVELLKFGYDWLRFSLFGESTIKIKGEIRSAKEKELAEKAKGQPEK